MIDKREMYYAFMNGGYFPCITFPETEVQTEPITFEAVVIRPALMKPKADRIDCYLCHYRDLDSDGVADGCMAKKCIRSDRRDPWGG